MNGEQTQEKQTHDGHSHGRHRHGIRMDGEKLERYYKSRHRCRGAGYLRFILLAFACFRSFGFPEPTGIVSALSGFAAPCFYILSGYFVLPPDEEWALRKTVRKIKRTALCMAVMTAAYIPINIIVCLIKHITVTFSRRGIFNFLVLNLFPLPVGDCVWFIHSMLYAYIVIFIAYKLKLMRFYKPVLVGTLVIMLLTGEFAGLIHFNVLGYNSITGCWLTRALPYILLGKLLRDNEEKLLKIKTWQYIAAWFVGALLTLGEIYILARTGFLVFEGHMIGYGIMAVAACGIALSKPMGRHRKITNLDAALSGVSYIFMEPLYYLLALLAGNDFMTLFSYFGGLAALSISVLLAFIIGKRRKVRRLFT